MPNWSDTNSSGSIDNVDIWFHSPTSNIPWASSGDVRMWPQGCDHTSLKRSVVKQRGPWATFFAVFRTQCPRARSRYHNRINVYLSHPVTLLLSRVRQAGFAVNTRLEGEAVPDSRLWGFYPRHLWNNDRNACLRVVVLLFFSGDLTNLEGERVKQKKFWVTQQK